MTLAELLVVDVLVLIAVLAVWLIAGVQRRNTWPEASPRIACPDCDRTFLDQRTLHLHDRANHLIRGARGVMYEPYEMPERERARIRAVPAVQTPSDPVHVEP